MKILHILNYVGRGGSESYIKNLIESKSQNIEHELIYNVDGGGVDDFDKLGIKTIQCNFKSPFDLNAAKFIKNYAIKNNVDLVHTHFMRENGIVFLAKILGLKIPAINTRHMVNKISKKAALLNKIFFMKNKFIIAVSSIVRDRLISEGANKNKIITLPPPFPKVDNFQKIGKSDDEKWIISLGRLSKEKGPDFFVDGIMELFKDSDYDNYKAIIIGYGDMETEIKEKIKSYNLDDRIRLLGYIKNPCDYLSAADLYVNHSYEEAFGLSIVEAAYSNTPILLPQSAGAIDYFNAENKSAIVFKMGDIDDFVKKLKLILSDDELKNNLTINACEIIKRDITREKIAQAIENIYEGAIHGSKKN